MNIFQMKLNTILKNVSDWYKCFKIDLDYYFFIRMPSKRQLQDEDHLNLLDIPDIVCEIR